MVLRYKPAKQIRVIIKDGKRYDIDRMRKDMETGNIDILSDVTAIIASSSHQMATAFGMKIDDGSFLDRLISLDFVGVRERYIEEIADMYSTGKNTTLAKIKAWERTCIIYKKKAEGRADRWGIDYHQFARLTGVEVIVY